ncbi:MAG: MiaB/RimO family radical SAM methylthiotransferase [Bradymonadaceae bacterium]
MKVHFITFGCKANQYDTERFRQELEARGAVVVDDPALADTCVVNTCTVTNQADAVARKAIRRVKREQPRMRVVVAGCSAALHPERYGAMAEVFGVVRGHEPDELSSLIAPDAPLLERDEEPIGAALLERNAWGTRGFMKIQDGCDRRCSFCATRLARGKSRSRAPRDLVSEAARLAGHHREIVITGIHIGHYGLDLNERGRKSGHSLATLMRRLLDEVPDTRFRVGSVEATEIDDLMLELLETSGGRLVPHLHVPMQAGSERVLRAMQRWHTRDQYRRRILEIGERLPYLGLGADVIVGFPGERDEDFDETRRLVEELPFTYLHVFPYSVRDHTIAATLPDQIPSVTAAERSRILRDLAMEKGMAYRRGRVGQGAEIIVEEGDFGLTEDYLRVRLKGDLDAHRGRIVYAPLKMEEEELVARIG